MKNLVKKIFGRDDRFFKLLESSAEEGYKGAKLLEILYASIGKPEFNKILVDLQLSRKEGKKYVLIISEFLCTIFATPIDREDIEALANALYKISKNAYAVGERMSICPEQFTTDIVQKQIELLVRATETIVRMTTSLRKMKHLEKIQDDYEIVQTIEGDADRLMVGLLKELYQGNVEAKEVIILKDLYELLEGTIDYCRDAAKVIFQVVLKYS